MYLKVCSPTQSRDRRDRAEIGPSQRCSGYQCMISAGLISSDDEERFRLLTNNCKKFLPAALALLVIVSLAAAQARKTTMVFAVSAESGAGSMDAVVMIDGKQLRVPFSDEQKDRQKRVAEEYFA